MTDPTTPSGEGTPERTPNPGPDYPSAPVIPPAASDTPPPPPAPSTPPSAPPVAPTPPPAPPAAPSYQAAPAYDAAPKPTYAPAPPAAPNYGAPAAPSYGAPGAPAYAAPGAPGGPAKTPILSIIGLVAGVVGILISFLSIGIGGFLFSVAAVVLGFIGRRKEPQAKGFWLTSIILGFAGLLLSIILFVVLGILFATSNSYNYSY